jgi:hypothetical protein
MEDYKKNRRYTADKFAELGDKNPYSNIDQLNYEYESEAGISNLINNIKIHFGRTYTKEEFIKKFACDKDAFKNYQYCSTSSQPNPNTSKTPIDSIFSCVKKHYDKFNRKITINRNGSLVVKPEDKNTTWIFSKTYFWAQYNRDSQKTEWTGKWECDGEYEFKIFSNDGEIYESKDRPKAKWKKLNSSGGGSGTSGSDGTSGGGGKPKCSPITDAKIIDQFKYDNRLLRYPNDKNYRYLKIGEDWFAKNINNKKVFNISKCGYTSSVEKLNSKFPSETGTTTADN